MADGNRRTEIESAVSQEFNALPQEERIRIGRFMDLERMNQLRRDRKRVEDVLAVIDNEICRVQRLLQTRPEPVEGEW